MKKRLAWVFATAVTASESAFATSGPRGAQQQIQKRVRDRREHADDREPHDGQREQEPRDAA